MNIIQQLITTNFTGRSGHQIIRITLHTAVSGADTLYFYFNNPNSQASSTYYVNGKGEVYQYVLEEKAPYSNSNLDSNIRSLTIETWDNQKPNDPVRTPEMYESCSQLVAFICQKYSIPCKLVAKADATNWNVKGIDLHNYFNPNKTCPAGLDVNRIIDRANQILQQTPMDEQIAHDGSNLVGYKLSDGQVAFETNALNTTYKGDHGLWYQTFRNNPECLNFKVDTLNQQIKTLTADNAELANDNAVLTDENNKLKTVVQEQNQTIDDQKKVIADQLSTITEQNRALDMKQAQIDKLQNDLIQCEAGQTQPDIVIRIWIRIKQLFKGA